MKNIVEDSSENIAEKGLLFESYPSPLDYEVHVFNNNNIAPFLFIQLTERKEKDLKIYFFLEDRIPAPFKFLKKGQEYKLGNCLIEAGKIKRSIGSSVEPC